MSKRNKRCLKKAKRECPVCANKVVEFLYAQRFHLYIRHCLPAAYDVVSCKKCGFVYVDTSAQQENYNYFYSDFSKYESSVGPGGKKNTYESDKYERMVKDLTKLVRNKNISILDVGCAKGGLLDTLKLHGYHNLMGLDPSIQCVNLVKKHGINAIQGGIFKENFLAAGFNQQFDCVIVSHVIEHVYDLNTAIKNLLNFVKKDGLLYLEVPDSSRYTQYYVAPYHYFDLEHINHFDEHSLNNLMSHYGCKLIATGKKDLQHSNVVYYPAVYVVYQKKNVSKQMRKIIPNFDVRENVARYIEMSRQARYWSELKNLVSTQKNIVIWGAGAYALSLYRTSMLRKCNIKAFIDNDHKKQGEKFNANIKICSPKTILKKFRGTIVVCSAVYNNEIVKEIVAMGVNNPVIVLK